MGVTFNHTIVHSRDARKSATFLAELLALPEPTRFGPFWVVELENRVSLDFMDVDGHAIQVQHYAFLISEDEFDAIFGRIRDRELGHWADPYKQRPGQINRNDGGRGVYFEDPDGHLLEVFTRPYGSGT